MLLLHVQPGALLNLGGARALCRHALPGGIQAFAGVVRPVLKMSVHKEAAAATQQAP